MQATFGKLDNQELKLEPGLNVISGGNEAGKSTWLAFLLAMLYGVDTKDRSKGGQLPDKLKYQPWSGKAMEGTMELETPQGPLTLERRSQSAPMADFRAWNTDTGSPLEELTGKSCGQALLGVEAAVYARSGYLRQQRISVSADAQLEKRLSGLVTSGNEDYAYAEIDEKLKRMQTAIRHNQTGALPRAEARLAELRQRLAELAESQHRLTELEAELQAQRKERDGCKAILTGLEALEQRQRLDRVNGAEDALAAAREDREGWEAVCGDLPDQETLIGLQAELEQLQSDLQQAALEEGLSVSELELPEPDPIFGRMDPRQAHDKVAADANLVKEAKAASRPKKQGSLPWLLLILVGLGAGFGGVLLTSLPLMLCGVLLALGGLGGWFFTRYRYVKAREAYIDLQQRARAVLTLYETKNAKGVVSRGIAYIRALEALEASPDGGESRRILAELADRRDDIYARLEELMPGCGSPDKAAALFQEAAQARNALAQARAIEAERTQQLESLQFTLGDAVQSSEDPEQYRGYDKVTEEIRLGTLETQVEALSSQADMLAGAISQMGDPLALNAEAEALEAEILKLQDRLAAIHLARKALESADEALRARFAPLLCEKAGEIFLRLTGGKYDKIQLDRSLHITVHPVESPVFRPLSYLSGGTVDQLYLALRLAICDLLIPDAPIVLDDALVYFDDKRAALALETLRELSKTRQILIFTCQSREKAILDRLAKERRAAEQAKA